MTKQVQNSGELKQRKVSLVILNKNDIEGLKAIYPRIPVDLLYEIVVIDGKSTDGTREFCDENGIRIIVQEKLGRGEAFRIAASLVEGEYVIFLSSDGNEVPEDIPKFIQLLDEGNDIVIASRLMNGSRNKEDGVFLPVRKWALQAFTATINLLWRGNLTDVWNGYRAFNTEKFRELPTIADGHLIELQQTIRALKRGYRIVEFPTIEERRVSGRTRNPLIKTGAGLISVLVKEVISGKEVKKMSSENMDG